jgi:hypothetical protein
MLGICMLSAWCSAHAAAPAALVEFAAGHVSAVDGAGTVRPLAKGAEVQRGDTIETGTGRVQLRFSDGAYVSLQPGSQFRIDEYNYTGKSDDSERGFFSLIKGGLRTITGLIGRTNRRNYQVRVPVATIGIRGTEYTVFFDGQALGAVGEGEISVCNSAGCLNVTSGQSYVVANANVKPTLTTVRSFLAPPPPPRFVPRHSGTQPAHPADPSIEFGSVFSSNDEVDQNGNRKALQGTDTTVFGNPDGNTGQPIVLATTAAIFTAPGTTHESGTSVGPTTGNVQGARLISWADGIGTTNSGTTTIVDSGNLGQIAWGRFTNGTLGGDGDNAGLVLSGDDSFHYIAAKATPVANLPVSGTLRFTQIAGSTTPTTTTSTAQLLAAALVANFTQSTATATVSLRGPDTNGVTITGSSAIVGNLFGGSAVGFGTACSGNSCSGSFSGVFAGPQVQYAGFTYDVQGTSFGSVRGAVVLHR